MFQTLSRICHKDPQYNPICSILVHIICYCPRKINYLTYATLESPKIPSCSKINQTHKDLSSVNFYGIAETVISRCSHLWVTNQGETCTSLKDYLFRLSSISPDIVRRFWRVSELKPQDVLEMLLGFEPETGKLEFEVKKVESLWGIFKWASEQTREFEHFPLSCKLMASMLVRAGFYREAEYLLSRRESQGILLDCQGVFCDLIEGYLEGFELNMAISAYERMRRLDLVPSVSNYGALIKSLVEVNETQSMYHIYVDMIKMGMGGSVQEAGVHDNVIRLLCIDGKVQEARDLVKEVVIYEIRPNKLVIDAISCGYCKKKDYVDLLRFFAEVRIAPDVVLGNKILFSLCRDYGVEEADMFLENLEELGFCPDEIALGILIGFSCHEGNLKNALFYISEVLSRGLKPHVYSYNALLSGMFKEGMWMHTRGILLEMGDMGVTPDLSTFRVLLAGFCKARQFDEVKAIVREMADRNLIKIASSEDPLTKGFMLLGLSPSDVKIRRDNDKGLCKTEFYDSLGNGLYLDTDLDEFDKRITEVLDDAMIPDFNSSIIEHFDRSDLNSTLVLVDEMAKWGQEMSLPALSSLLSRLSRAPFSVDAINRLLGVISTSTYQLDLDTLNMLIQTFSKKGCTFRARTLFDGMIHRGYVISNDTYWALLFGACKIGDLRSFSYYFKLAQKSDWFPEAKRGKALLGYLCKNKWFNEALKLFETMLSISPCDVFDTFHALIEDLCCQGFTSAACVLVEEFSNQGSILDQMDYSLLVGGFCREKRFTEAFRVLEIMLSQNLSPPLDVSTQLISHLCRTNIEKAVELKNICLRDQPSALLPTNCALINGLCNSGRTDEAAALFKEVLFKGLLPHADIFNSVIEGYCQRNNLKKVSEILGFMVRKNISISVSSYSTILRMICKEGNFSLALRSKELMLQITSIPELVLYNILIFHISSSRNSLLLDAVIDALQKKGLRFDNISFNFAIRGFLWCNDAHRSLHYLTTMIRQDLRPSNRSSREVISCLCHNRELELAIKLSREMESRGWVLGSVIQNRIVESLIDNGKLHEAVEFLDRMASKNLIPDNVKYDYLIKKFYQHRRLDKAVDLLNIMLQKGTLPESTSYDYVIRGFCNSHKLDMALDFYTEMLYKGLKPSFITWDILVGSLCEYGRVEEAEKLLKSMMDLGETPSREIFNSVINSYRSRKNISKTSEIMKLMQEKGHVPDFDTHWSLISNLSNSSKKDGPQSDRSFLSSLLSGFGFSPKKN